MTGGDGTHVQGETGIGPLDTLAVWALAIGAVVGLVGLLWRAIRSVQRATTVMEQVLGDWRGVPDRPGVPGRPGVMERIERIERELFPNHGSSLRDAVDLTNRRLARLCGDGESSSNE